MNSVFEQKKELRKKLINKREAIPKYQWESNSTLIKNHVLSNREVKKAHTIHCFISMNERQEVETLSLIGELIDLGKQVVVPVTNFRDNSLYHSKLYSLDDLEKNKWGVLEPNRLEEIKTEKIELVLVPLLAADMQGNRIGYGKGFYDRFLSTIEESKIGLVFDEFILKKIPTEPFDRKLDALISESGIKYTKQTI